MLYLDTSALLKLYLIEDGSEFVHQQVTSQDLPLPVWEIQEMEIFNALQLKVFWNELDQKTSAQQWHYFEERKAKGLYLFSQIDRSLLQTEFRRLAKETPKLGCQTLDILHVACAVTIQATSFLSYDERQKKLATLAGLNVIE